MISVFDGMLGSEEEQMELKRWTDANYSKLDGLAGDKAALGDETENKKSEIKTPEPSAGDSRPEHKDTEREEEDGI